MKKNLPFRLAAAGVMLALVCCFTYLFLPADVLVGIASRALARDGYVLTVAKARKAFPLGLKLRNAELSDRRGSLLKLDEIVIAPRLLPLLAGKLSASVDAKIASGTISGNVSPGGDFDISLRRIPLDAVPFFPSVTGAAVKGLLTGRGKVANSGGKLTGDLQAEVTGAEISDVSVGGIALPSASYERIQGKMTIKGGKATLESINLQGDGLYARLSGDLSLGSPLGGSPLTLALELMPKPEFLEKQKLVFLLLAKYLQSPGHYRIPVQGTLTAPAIP